MKTNQHATLLLVCRNGVTHRINLRKNVRDSSIAAEFSTEIEPIRALRIAVPVAARRDCTTISKATRPNG